MLPQELLHWYVIPTIRSYLVTEFKSDGLKNEEIAKLLDITPSAVSYYLNGKRGKEIKLNYEFIKIIKKSKKRLFKKKSNAFFELVYLSNYYLKKGYLCEICKSKNNIEECKLNNKCKFNKSKQY